MMIRSFHVHLGDAAKAELDSNSLWNWCSFLLMIFRLSVAQRIDESIMCENLIESFNDLIMNPIKVLYRQMISNNSGVDCPDTSLYSNFNSIRKNTANVVKNSLAGRFLLT